MTPGPDSKFARPYLFLVTDIPDDFAKWLVETAIHPVRSELKVLFAVDGESNPCDYITTLSNFNFRTDTEHLKECARDAVRNIVIRTLFIDDTAFKRGLENFIFKHRDNIPSSLSHPEAVTFIRNSVKITSFEVVVPKVSIRAMIYNVYIHPPTKNVADIEVWKSSIMRQRFYAGKYGVGTRYGSDFNCNHCKTIDHPSGLCPLVADTPPTEAEAELGIDPFLDTTPIPTTTSTHQGRLHDPKGKGKMRAMPDRQMKAGPSSSQTPRTNPKRRKFT